MGPVAGPGQRRDGDVVERIVVGSREARQLGPVAVAAQEDDARDVLHRQRSENTLALLGESEFRRYLANLVLKVLTGLFGSM